MSGTFEPRAALEARLPRAGMSQALGLKRGRLAGLLYSRACCRLPGRWPGLRHDAPLALIIPRPLALGFLSLGTGGANAWRRLDLELLRRGPQGVSISQRRLEFQGR